MAMHVDTDDKTSTLIQVSGYNYQNSTFESPRGMTVIKESGVYALVFLSLLCNPCCNYCTGIALAECIIM